MKGKGMQVFTNKSKELMGDIERYLEGITAASLHFGEAMKDYIHGRQGAFDERIQKVTEIERKGDDDLKDIKYKLYAFMLIPDTRGDVYMLMDDLDDILDYIKRLLLELSMENPEFPECIRENLLLMAEYSTKAVESLMLAVRSLFNHTKAVEEHVYRVEFYEKEVDGLEEQLIRFVFQSADIPLLANRMQIRDFCGRIASLSDISEDISKNLLVYAVKRMV